MMTSNTLGMWVLLGLAILAAADITAIMFAGYNRTWADRIGWILLGAFLLTCAAIGLAGCGPHAVLS